MRSLAVLAIGAALAASATFAQAQAPTPPAAPEAPRENRAGRPEFNRADMEALVDARVAGLQAGLKLTPDQQRYFPAVEQAIRSIAAARIAEAERRRETRDERRGDAERPDFQERLERGSQGADERAERLKALASAMRPLWTSLDENQKRLLPVLIRPVGHDGGSRGGRRGGHHGRHGHHGGGDGPGRR